MKASLTLVCLLVTSSALAGGLRDPMRPPQPHAAARAAVRDTLPVVSAVFTRGEQRKAIVDGRFVKAGDEIGSGRIAAISADGVAWVRKGITHQLPLSAAVASVKKPAVGPPRIANGAP